ALLEAGEFKSQAKALDRVGDERGTPLEFARVYIVESFPHRDGTYPFEHFQRVAAFGERQKEVLKVLAPAQRLEHRNSKRDCIPVRVRPGDDPCRRLRDLFSDLGPLDELEKPCACRSFTLCRQRAL